MEKEIKEAYIECFGEYDESLCQEAYVGQYESDKEFAQSMADEIVNIPTAWPYYCIDWEYAASELMMDYSKSDGYYFRKL